MKKSASHREDSTGAEEEEESHFTTQSTVIQSVHDAVKKNTFYTNYYWLRPILILIFKIFVAPWAVTNRAVVTLQPSWPEIYYRETITLRCEIQDGEDTEWEYQWAIPSSHIPQTRSEYTIRYASFSHNGDYRCMGIVKRERTSTDWSDAFTLTLSNSKSWVAIFVCWP